MRRRERIARRFVDAAIWFRRQMRSPHPPPLPGDPNCFCEVCGGPFTMEHYGYMLDDALWGRLNVDPEGFAHLACAFAELGRRPHPSDFKDVPLNALVRELFIAQNL